ncbi:hypothetical protein E4T47_04986 [Aureobasidium subglaciale]|nr:hypothetical protein E4T43_01878 [Aureobasidium subglaciale]KAI5271719.1 hypothetical protein E4T47_04986 [Aureobasidium subglaciale]
MSLRARLEIGAVDNNDDDNAMYQVIQEWVLNAQREAWRLEASEQHSNPKPPEKLRITTISGAAHEDIKGIVERRNEDVISVKLRKHEAAQREIKTLTPGFSHAFPASRHGG